MLRQIAFATLLLIAFGPAAQSARAADVSASAIDKIFAPWDTTRSPGMVVAVIRDGQIIHQRGYGMANLEHDVPISPDTVFYIASTSKQFTAACIALLVRQGKISLDDEVRKYVAELPDYGKPLTIRHLVHHTAGTRDYLGLAGIAGRTTWGLTLDDAIETIARQRELNFAPGDEFSYSNSGYGLMAEIVKRASGKTLREFSQEFIFKPLGMEHSVFRDDNTLVIKHRATGYDPAGGGFRTNDAGIESVGSGNLWTTVGDLAKWDQNFYDEKLGKGLTNDLLSTGKLNSGQALPYAFGLFVDEHRGLNRVQHGGAFAGFRTEMVRFPDQRLTVIVLSNLGSVNPTALANKVAELYLSDQMKPDEASAETAVAKLSAEQLAAASGKYRDPRDGTIWPFDVSAGALKLSRFVPWGVKLEALEGQRFRTSGEFAGFEFEFLPPSDSGQRRVRVLTKDAAPQVFEAITPVELNAEKLTDYAATYCSDEADTEVTLSVDGGKLFVQGDSIDRQALRPSVADEFIVNGGAIQFERDGSGQITGLRYSMPRIRRLWFARQGAKRADEWYRQPGVRAGRRSGEQRAEGDDLLRPRATGRPSDGVGRHDYHRGRRRRAGSESMVAVHHRVRSRGARGTFGARGAHSRGQHRQPMVGDRAGRSAGPASDERRALDGFAWRALHEEGH
jgi:CubicO group peptidase (beta-lactamase class C family)